jgi:hypothetical protein
MRNILTIALLSVALVGLTASAETNKVATSTNTVVAPSLSLTNAADSGKAYGGYELTLGGGGTSIDGENAFGIDVSLSTNPFEKRPEIWVGVAQSLYWEPKFAGSTDLFVDWSQPILPSKLDDKLYLNVGWSGGVLYGDYDQNPTWRTGPELTLQYYTSGNAFIYAGVNYDVFESNKQEGGFRYGFGIGLTF